MVGSKEKSETNTKHLLQTQMECESSELSEKTKDKKNEAANAISQSVSITHMRMVGSVGVM